MTCNFYTRLQYDRWSPHYDQQFVNDFDYRAPYETYRTLSAITDLTRPALTILDIGTGTGLQAAEIRAANPHAYIVGIDLSWGMLTQCRDKNTVNSLIQGNIAKHHFPLAANSFDIITCTGVMELIANPTHIIAEMARLLKNNGLMSFTAPHSWRDRWRKSGRIRPDLSSFLNWVDRGHSHREAGLLSAMQAHNITMRSTTAFCGYYKNGSATPYQLYIGQYIGEHPDEHNRKHIGNKQANSVYKTVTSLENRGKAP